MTRALTPVASSPTDPRFTTVVSSSGFSAGDYVYQRPDGTYGPVGNGLVANANFNVDQSLFNLNTDVTAYAGYDPKTVGGTSRKDMVAKLSNGNLVYVYMQLATVGGLSANRAIFTIVDPAGATVVAPTQVSNTIFPTHNVVSVVALTGGGFVLYFIDTTNAKPTFGIYTNTGTVTTALAVDTAATTIMDTTNGYVAMNACSLPNGGFAFAYPSSGNTILTRAYDSVGTPTYVWTSLGGTQTSMRQPVRIAARSDSSTALIFCTITANTFRIARVSTGGALVNHDFSVTSQAGSSQYFDLCCLPNDTFVAVYYNNPGNNVNTDPRYITLPISNVLGTPVSVPAGSAFMAQNMSNPNIFVAPLSSNGFIVFFEDANYTWYYVPYNSSGVAQNVGTNPPVFGGFASFGPTMHPSFIETSGYLDIYYAVGLDALANGGTNHNQYYNYKTTIELTTYNIYSPTTTTAVVGTSSQPVTNYARINSTPTNAAFFANTTGTVAVNLPRSNITLATRQVDSSFVPTNGYFALDTNASGQILIAFKSTAGTSSAVRALLYSNTGTLLSAITVATWDNSSSGTIDAAFLSNGKIVIVDGRNTNTANIYVYNSTLTTLLASNIGVLAQTGKVAVAGLRGTTAGLFAFAHINASGYACHAVFNDAAVSVLGSSAFDSNNATSTNLLSICPLSSGGFAVRWYNSTTSVDRLAIVSQRGATAFDLIFVSNAGTTGNYAGGKLVAGNNAGVAYFSYSSSTTGSIGYRVHNQTSAATQILDTTLVIEATVAVSGKFSMGVTGTGVPVVVNPIASNGGIAIFNPGIRGVSTPTTTATITDYAGTPYTTVAPWLGNNIVVAYINNLSRISFAILNALPSSVPESLTAGVTPSNAALTLNPSSSSGYTLIGVAATDCAAGGAGQVQVNGVATVNSQYSASTAYQGFDFQVPGNRGVRGTVAGNVVTLIGDA
jgi:hypothetical protein